MLLATREILCIFDLELLEGATPPHSDARARPPGAPHARYWNAMGGICPSAAAAAPLSPPPELPAAEGQGGGAAAAAAAADDNNNNFSPLLDLLERFPDLFALKVLVHLDPIDRTFLAQAGVAFRAAVEASGLPLAGTRRVEQGMSVWVVTHRLREFCTSVERLAWAKKAGCPWVEKICSVAAFDGNLEVLRWAARDQRCPWNEDTCYCAAEGGHLEVLQWARKNGCPWDTRTCSHAARGGHLGVLRWARQHHCPWNSWTCAKSAWGGHLEVLRWARDQGCPWDKTTCELAAMGGHLEVLRWAREHGCRWDRGMCKYAAAAFRHPEIEAWLCAQP